MVSGRVVKTFILCLFDKLKEKCLKKTTELKIDATGELRLPKGETAQRPSTQGGIRFNTNYNGFEGTSVSGSVSLQGIYDSDRDTYLDLSNNQFNFVGPWL